MSMDLFVRFTEGGNVETMTFPRDMRVAQVAEDIAQKFAVPENTALVRSPTSLKSGEILPADATIGSLTFNSDQDIVEVWNKPATIVVLVCHWEGSREFVKEKKSTLLDFGCKYASVIPTLQRTLNLPNTQEFCCQYCAGFDGLGKPTGARKWITNLPLSEQGVLPTGVLICVPLSNMPRVSESSLQGCNPRGWLYKRSFKREKRTQKQKRLFVFSDVFLYYFRKENESAPAGVIPLQYFTITKRIKKKKYGFLLSLAVGYFQSQTLTYKLQTDTQESLDNWIDSLSKHCLNANTRKIFGTPLQDLLARKSNRGYDIPIVVRDCACYLYANALKCEGLFRISAETSLLEYYKANYDSGNPVDLSTVTDHNIPAALLKYYLRELPEPLIPPFASSELLQSDKLPPPAKLKRLGEIFATFPRENYTTLKYIFTLLGNVIANEEFNKMGPANLATMFGPNLLRSDTGSMEEMGAINTMTKLLITNYEQICQTAESLNPALVTVVSFDQRTSRSNTAPAAPVSLAQVLKPGVPGLTPGANRPASSHAAPGEGRGGIRSSVQRGAPPFSKPPPPGRGGPAGNGAGRGMMKAVSSPVVAPAAGTTGPPPVVPRNATPQRGPSPGAPPPVPATPPPGSPATLANAPPAVPNTPPPGSPASSVPAITSPPVTTSIPTAPLTLQALTELYYTNHQLVLSLQEQVAALTARVEYLENKNK